MSSELKSFFLMKNRWFGIRLGFIRSLNAKNNGKLFVDFLNFRNRTNYLLSLNISTGKCNTNVWKY